MNYLYLNNIIILLSAFFVDSIIGWVAKSVTWQNYQFLNMMCDLLELFS